MSKLSRYRVWDGELLHDVSALEWMQGGVMWSGPGVGQGWVFLDKEFWEKKMSRKPDTDLLLEEVEPDKWCIK